MYERNHNPRTETKKTTLSRSRCAGSLCNCDPCDGSTLFLFTCFASLIPSLQLPFSHSQITLTLQLSIIHSCTN